MNEFKAESTVASSHRDNVTPPETNMSNEPTFHPDDSREDTIRKIRTADSIAVPRDVFEKLYLSPQQPAAGHLRKTFGNPTPVALIGFLLSSTPNGMILMGWRGAGGGGAAILPVFIFFGGLIQLIAGIGEWILGNTFSCCIFFTYGTFWIVQGTSLQPFFCVGGAYSPTGNCAEGATTPEFYATTGFYLVCLTMVSLIFMICSIRTNVVLFSALLFLVIAFGSIAGTYFHLALGNVALAGRLQVCGGAFTFILSLCVWYLLLVQMLEAVDFPFSLPVGDLTSVVPGKSLKTPAREHMD